MNDVDQLNLFRRRATQVSAVVHDVMSLSEAMTSAVDLCATDTSTPIPADSGTGTTNGTAATGSTASLNGLPPKTLSAPEFEGTDLETLTALCRDRGVTLIPPPLRPHARGISMGITRADYGIAETGTLVIQCAGEDKRLASMVSHIHVALLPVTRIRATALDLAGDLEEMMMQAHSYTAFVTGPSRTADIERVLALGVHGPLELHIMLLET